MRCRSSVRRAPHWCRRHLSWLADEKEEYLPVIRALSEYRPRNPRTRSADSPPSRLQRLDTDVVFPSEVQNSVVPMRNQLNTQLTTLESGLRVVSRDTFGHLSTYGLVADCGSLYEQKSGLAQLLEMLAFSSTSTRSSMDVMRDVEAIGGIVNAATQRDHGCFILDALRRNMETGMDLLGDCLLNPLYDPMELEQAKEIMRLQARDTPLEMHTVEAQHEAAWGRQALGRQLRVTEDANLDDLTLKDLYDHRMACFHPSRLVVSGAGVEHEYMVELAQKYVEDRLPTGLVKPPARPYSEFEPGHVMREVHHEMNDKGLVKVAFSWESVGWQHDDAITMALMQTLLGGGDSFSAGGPGKGLLSQLYIEILNKFSMAEGAEAQFHQYDEEGIFSLVGTSKPDKASELSHALCEFFVKYSYIPVNERALSRAKQMLKVNLLTLMESRLVLFEDMGRQVLTYGEVKNSKQICDKVESITADDIMRVVKRMLERPPAVSAVGPTLDFVPSRERVDCWFGVKQKDAVQ